MINIYVKMYEFWVILSPPHASPLLILTNLNILEVIVKIYTVI